MTFFNFFKTFFSESLESYGNWQVLNNMYLNLLVPKWFLNPFCTVFTIALFLKSGQNEFCKPGKHIPDRQIATLYCGTVGKST